MQAPALPLGPYSATLDYVPRVAATRFIPAVYQPSFGILPYAVLAGTVRSANAFFSNTLQFFNTLPAPLPPTNMVQNRYLGYMPGISRVPQA